MKKRLLLCILGVLLCWLSLGAGSAWAATNAAKTIDLTGKLVYDVDLADAGELYEDVNSSYGAAEKHRFADGISSFTYRVAYPEDVVSAYVYFRIRGRDALVQSSTDNQTFATLYEPSAKDGGADYREGDDYYFDMTERLQGGSTLYIRFGDSKPADGNGADVYAVSFSARREVRRYQPAADEDCDVAYTTADNPDYLTNEHYSFNREFGYVWCDRTGSLDYRFPLNARLTGLELVVYAHAGYDISVSADGKDWVGLDIADIKYFRYDETYYYDGGNYGDYRFDVSFLLEGGARECWVRLADSTTHTGYGGQYEWLALKQYRKTDGSAESLLKPGVLRTEVPLAARRFLAEDSGSEVRGAYRSVQGDAYFVYRLDLPETATSLALAMSVERSLDLLYSYDGSSYRSVPKSYFASGSEYLAKTGYTANLTPLLGGGTTLYLKFMDGNTADDMPLVVERLVVFYNDSAVANQNKKEYETYDISMFTDANYDEKDFIYELVNGPAVSVGRRFFDYQQRGVYRFSYGAGYEGLKIIGTVKGSYYLQYSTDAQHWNDLAVCPVPIVAGVANVPLYLHMDLSDRLDLSRAGTLYLRLTDAVDDNGDGALVEGLGVALYAGAEKPFEVHPVDLQPDETEPQGCGGRASGSCALLGALTAAAAARWAVRKKRRGSGEV